MQNIRHILDDLITTLPQEELPDIMYTWKYFLLTEKWKDANRILKTIKFDCITESFKHELCILKDASLVVNSYRIFMFDIDTDWKEVKTQLNKDIWRLFKAGDIKKRLITFFQKSNILYCPFCGINQLQVYQNVSNFDIDHFLPKSLYPQYAFSLYNLIPICKHCNQNIKKDRDPLEFATANPDNKWSIFHPYFWWLNIVRRSIWKYGISLWNKGFWNDVSFNWSGFLDSNHARYFKLKDIYWDSPLVSHDVKYMFGKRQNIREQKAHVKLITKVTKQNQLDRVTEDWYPTSESKHLTYPNWKFRKDLVEWMKENLQN